MVLEMIQKENDIKKLSPEQLVQLSDEIRQFLIEKISRTGGHLASNLGVVELTMALHLTLDFPDDKLIWDVGHQSYTHKLLTGRKGGFDELRKYGGMSGFPKRKESDCDAFDTGPQLYIDLRRARICGGQRTARGEAHGCFRDWRRITDWRDGI